MNPTLQAFKEIFPYLETIDARSETIMQLLRTRGMINQISFDEKFTEVKHRTHVKWDALRVKLDDMMKEEHS